MVDKMPDIPIRALKIILNKLPNTTLTIVGSGPKYKDLQKLVTHLSLLKSTLFIHHISDINLVKYYHQSHFTIVPSFAEMQSLVTLESLACGTPIVTSDAFYNAAKNIVLENDCGVVFHHNSPTDLADKIINVVMDNVIYENFVNNCFNTREKYSYKLICQQWLNEMTTLVNHNCVACNN